MPELADIRLANALLLYSEFVVREARGDATTLERGLEGRFAERLRVKPSYWSQLKSGKRHIGETLARQFEALGGKPVGWLDRERSAPANGKTVMLPRGPHERMIVNLVLDAYRARPSVVLKKVLELSQHTGSNQRVAAAPKQQRKK